MATLDIEPVELPPGRVEEMPLPGISPETKPAPETNPAPASAEPVNGADLLKTPESAPVQTIDEKLPPVGPNEYRKMEDYRKLDWSKSNSQLAEIAGVSRARIGQVRKLIEAERGNQAKTATPQNENIPAADFSDVNLPPGMAHTPSPGGAASPETRPDYLAMAKVTFGMSEGLLCTVFGPEWKRESEEEAMSICIPLSACLEIWGMKDLPPTYVLCFVSLAYAGKRVNKPSTKDKITRMWLWVKSRFSWIRKRKPIQKEENDTGNRTVA